MMPQTMKYIKITAYATSALALFAALNYFFPIRKEFENLVENAEIRKVIKEEKNRINLSLDKGIYQAERNWLAIMYWAARKVPSNDTRCESLRKVVNAALEVNDLNVALMAADDIPCDPIKCETLILIVKQAVKDEVTFGYAALAAEKVPSLRRRGEALNIVIGAIEKSLAEPSKTTKPQPFQSERERASE